MMIDTQILLYLVVAVILGFFLLNKKTSKIEGIVEIPGWPIVGNLLQMHMAGSYSEIFEEWAQKYGPIFQVRMGSRYVVVANSFDAIKKLWVEHQSSMISRPMLYTFHSVVSTSQAFTIGSSPWDKSCQRRRKAAAMVLNPGAVLSYAPAISSEIESSLYDLYHDTQAGHCTIQPKMYFKKFVLNISLTVSFGTRVSTTRDAVLQEIVEVEETLTRFRSHTNNLQDYLPILRWLPSKTNKIAKEFSARRDRYMDMLTDGLKKEIADGTDVPCSVGNVLKNKELSFNYVEFRSLSLTLLSAGLDTIPGNLIQGTAVLATEEGQAMQQKLFDHILEVYPSFDQAWDALVVEEKVPYLKAFVLEVLRYFSIVPMGFPRSNIQPMTVGEAVIPSDTCFFMNTRCANFDPLRFDDPLKFNPERHLGDVPRTAMPHYTFGAGSRVCVGQNLAVRSMYAMFGRMILAWKIGAVGKVITDPNEFNEFKSSLVAEPHDWECSLIPRDLARGKLDSLVTNSAGLTRPLSKS